VGALRLGGLGRIEDVEELCNGDDLDPGVVQVADEIEIALHIVIAGDDMGGISQNGCLQDNVVLGVTTELYQARWSCPDGFTSSIPEERFDFLFINPQAATDPWSAQNITARSECETMS
jgi:hypothetical protein